MGAPCVSACTPWATTDDICSPCDDYSFPAGLLDDMLSVATDLLFELSGKRFPGSCQDVVRPCSQSFPADPFPNRVAGQRTVFTNSSNGSIQVSSSCGCSSPRSCGCARLSEVTLGVEPITEINEIKVDGAILPSSSYRIDDYKFLVRTDGESWPCCQNLLNDPDTDDDTFQVDFTYGTPPPPAGVHAAAVLACELALACQPETLGECRLPRRVQSITRQGVSMVLLDPFEFLDQGRVGIIEVDLFLRTYNPNRLRRAATVISPDITERVRRVNT